MDQKVLKHHWDEFIAHITVANLAANVFLSLVMYGVSRLFSFAIDFKPDNEWLFFIFLAIAYFGVVFVIGFLFRSKSALPVLVGRIDAYSVARFMSPVGTPTNSQSGSFMSVLVSIRNSGTPTIIENWAFSVVLSDGSELVTERKIIPESLTLSGDAVDLVITPKDALEEKTIVSPVPTGGMAKGILLFCLPGIEPDNVSRAGNLLRLKFYDVLGREHIAEQKTQAKFVTKPIIWPGISASMKPPHPNTPPSSTQSTF